MSSVINGRDYSSGRDAVDFSRHTVPARVIRLELENRLASVEQQRVMQDAADRGHQEEWAERLHGAQQGEESARRELHSLRYWTHTLHGLISPMGNRPSNKMTRVCLQCGFFVCSTSGV